MRKLTFLFFVLFPAIALQASTRRFITYEEYGAVGDGVHDDQSAIVAAHQAANQLDLPVRATDGKTYLIGRGDKVAIIQTDTDWGTAQFVINDVETDTYTQAIFKVESRQSTIDLKGVSQLHREQKNLGITLPCRSLVYVENKQKRVYIRYGLNQNNGTAQQEVLIVDKKGRVDDQSPITWDYDQITKMTAYPIDQKTLTIRGGYFTTVANQAESKYNYRGRGIVIRRSNVHVEGLTHYVTDELDHGAPYSGFLSLDHCADVRVSNCLLTAHKTYGTIGAAGKPVSMGSYDMQAAYCVNILFQHGRQTNNIDDPNYWGLFASNFCKDLRMEDMVISRFDAHMGVANVTLKDCTFGHMGVQMVGFGTMLIQNCEIHRNRFIWLRDDYGSSWDGDIIIRDCTLKPIRDSRNLILVDGSNNGKHDFGYTCRMPRRIEIKNLTIDDSAITSPDYKGPVILGNFGRDQHATDLLPFAPVEEIIQSGVKVLSGKHLLPSSS